MFSSGSGSCLNLPRQSVLPRAILTEQNQFVGLYNDSYGHQVGDDCLRKVAGAIQGAVKRSPDLVPRYDGEDFVVILPFMPTTRAVHVAEVIRQGVKALEIPHSRSSVSLCVRVSLGVASILPTPEELPTKLIAAADVALYQAKSSGRDAKAVHVSGTRRASV